MDNFDFSRPVHLVLSNTNGKVEQLSERQVENVLIGDPISSGYRPSIPTASLWEEGGGPRFWLYRDLEAMLVHPAVKNPLRIYQSGTSLAEFEYEASSPEVLDWGIKEFTKFWETARQYVVRSFEYGWMGGELVYEHENGYLGFDELYPFSARDVTVLTQRRQYVGFRLRNAGRIQVDLWGPRGGIVEDAATIFHPGTDSSYGYGQPKVRIPRTVPAKGFWYAHNPRTSRWYGESQLFGAWLPWCRLARPDGAEYIVDAAIYRFGCAGPVVKYPEEDRRDKAGNMIISRDMARRLAENIKSNMAAAVPSSCYPADQGGKPKWEIVLPQYVMNVAPLDDHNKVLEKSISSGIGVPPELQEAVVGGLGNSGREVPMYAFLQDQQWNVQAFCKAWHDQIGEPLTHWNFGPEAWFRVKPKNLLKLMKQQDQPGQGGQEGEEQQPEEQPSPQVGFNGNGRLPAPKPSLNGSGKSHGQNGVGPRGGRFQLNANGKKRYGVQMALSVFNDLHPRGQPDNPGQFAKKDSGAGNGDNEHVGAIQHLAEFGRSLWAKGSAAEKSVKEAVRRNVDRLPEPLRLPVLGAYRVLTSTYAVGQATAREVAREVGGEENAERVGRILSIADLLMAEPAKVGTLAAGFPVAATVVSMAPMASLSYLAYSGARHPVATARAAKSLVKKARGAVKEHIGLSVEANGVAH